MTLLRTYRPGLRRNMEESNNPFSELLDQVFNSENNYDCNQYFAVPPANIVEKEKEFDIEIAVPGFKKSDFNIELKENLLVISLEKEDSEGENKKSLMREFNFNKFRRSFKLSDKVDKDNIKAHYNDGILRINIPKKSELIKNSNRSIEIS